MEMMRHKTVVDVGFGMGGGTRCERGSQLGGGGNAVSSPVKSVARG